MSYNLSVAFLSGLIYDHDRVNPEAVDSVYVDPQGAAWQLKRFYANEVNGYQGAIFANTATGQVILVNRDMKPTSSSDPRRDVDMDSGRMPNHFESAQEFYQIAAGLAASKNSSLLVTDRSLGGSLWSQGWAFAIR